MAVSSRRLRSGVVTLTDHERATAETPLLPGLADFLSCIDDGGKHQHVGVYLQVGGVRGGFDLDEEAEGRSERRSQVQRRLGGRRLSGQALTFAAMVFKHVQYCLWRNGSGR